MDIEKLSRALEGLTEEVTVAPKVDRRVSIPFTNYSAECGLPLSPDSNAALNTIHSNDSSRRSSSQSEAVLTPEEEARCRSNLYVSLLGEDVSDSDLRAIFDPFGAIESAVVMRNIHTGKSRGIAFVQFLDVDAAKRALESVNGMVLRGRAISVQVASRKALYAPGTPTNRVFVRNIPADIGEGVLNKHFSMYGEVLKITLHNDSAKAQAMVAGASTTSSTPPSRIAFVTFPTVEVAKKAAVAIHNSTPFPSCRDVPLLAKVAEDSTKRMERISRSQSLSSTPTSPDASRRASSEVQPPVALVQVPPSSDSVTPPSAASQQAVKAPPQPILPPVEAPAPSAVQAPPPQVPIEPQVEPHVLPRESSPPAAVPQIPPPVQMQQPAGQMLPGMLQAAQLQPGPFAYGNYIQPQQFSPGQPPVGHFGLQAYALPVMGPAPYPQVGGYMQGPGLIPVPPLPHFPPPYGGVGAMFSLAPGQMPMTAAVPGPSFAPRYFPAAGAYYSQPIVGLGAPAAFPLQAPPRQPYSK